MKKNRMLALILALLIAALVAVIAVIVYKQGEYQASEAFYQSLRTGAWRGGRVC